MLKETICNVLPTRWYLRMNRLAFRIKNPKIYCEQQKKRRFVTDESYSYKPFDDTRSIYVHIPKCGGVSVTKALYGNLAGGHTTLNEYLTIFEPERIISYFKFTVVRNPWDRVVSAYHFLKSGGFNKKDFLWYQKTISKYKSFDEFVKNWMNEDNIWKIYHFMPQYHFFKDKYDKIKLDHFAYLENLNEEYAYLASILRCNNELTKMNISDRSDYKQYYNHETIEIVGNLYRQDIDLLGYDFESCNVR